MCIRDSHTMVLFFKMMRCSTATTIVMDCCNRSVELCWYAQEPFVQLGNRQEWHCTKLDNEHNRRSIWGVVGVRTSCIDGSKERRLNASASVRGMLFANSSVPSTCFESVFSSSSMPSICFGYRIVAQQSATPLVSTLSVPLTAETLQDYVVVAKYTIKSK